MGLLRARFAASVTGVDQKAGIDLPMNRGNTWPRKQR